jgi:voltage-gated potassium channel
MAILRKFRKKIGWKLRKSKPDYNLSPIIYSQLKPFRLPLVLVQIIMIIGTIGYILIDDFTILDAIYQTGITFTTVGFGEVSPISHAGRFFTITLIIFGFAVFTLSIAILIDTVVKGRFFELYKEKRMLKQIATLKKHFVIFYHNEYTIQLAKEFRQNRISFVVVDSIPNLEEIAKQYGYLNYINEEPFSNKAFLKSQLSVAKGAISLSKNISDNITLIASVRLYEKDLQRWPYLIISNAQTKSDEEKLIKLGANKVVFSPSLMAKRVSAMAIRPDMENVLDEFLYKKDTPIDMEEVFVKEDSWLVNQTLKEIHLRDRMKVSVIGITQKSGKFIQMPKGTTLIDANCKLLLVGNNKGISKAKKLINKKEKPQSIENVI